MHASVQGNKWFKTNLNKKTLNKLIVKGNVGNQTRQRKRIWNRWKKTGHSYEKFPDRSNVRGIKRRPSVKGGNVVPISLKKEKKLLKIIVIVEKKVTNVIINL